VTGKRQSLLQARFQGANTSSLLKREEEEKKKGGMNILFLSKIIILRNYLENHYVLTILLNDWQ